MRFPLPRVLYLLAFLIGSVAGAYGQAVVEATDAEEILSIGRSAHFYRTDAALPIDEVVRLDRSGAFAPYLQDIPNFAATDEEVWLRFTVRRDVREPLYLHVGSAFIDRLQLYTMDGDRPRLLRLAGDDRPFAERDVAVPSFVFRLDIPPGGTRTFYLSSRSFQPLFYTLRVGTLEPLMEDLHTQDFIQGIYFGFMLLIFIYNGLLFVSTREKIYLYYAAYLFSITLFMGFIFQYFFQYLWPDYPQINRFAVGSSALTIFFAILFSRQFLSTRENVPGLHRVSYLFLAVPVVIVLLMVAGWHTVALEMAQVSILLMAVYLLVIGFAVHRQGFRPAKYYLLAWTVLIVSFVLAILESLNILPVSPYLNYLQIGSAIEVSLLSFALAYRINTYKRERSEAREQALQAAREKNAIVERQNEVLEERVAARTTQLNQTLSLVEEEKKKADHLLTNILPRDIATELKDTGHAEPRFFESVSVLFLDIVSFSLLTQDLPPSELVARLDRLFQGFDDIVRHYEIEKIKTIGDAYMAVAGVPTALPNHAVRTVLAARDIHAFVADVPPDSQGRRWEIRVGIHSGPVVAGVVGHHKFAYDIWGNTVNLAARMEARSEAGRINLSEATFAQLNGQIPCTYRGKMEAKNMGRIGMYFVD